MGGYDGKPNYDFARIYEENRTKLLKVGSIFLGICILVFVFFSCLGSLQLFSSSEYRISQPVKDPTRDNEEADKESAKLLELYSQVQIPYRDPSGRFVIDFATPYVSRQIVVYIRTDKDRDKILSEVESILQNARKNVGVESVQYVNDY